MLLFLGEDGEQWHHSSVYMFHSILPTTKKMLQHTCIAHGPGTNQYL